jgi:hypothetical protein
MEETKHQATDIVIDGVVVHEEFDKHKRPRVGVGLMILNEFDEVLTSQRLKPGGPFHEKW